MCLPQKCDKNILILTFYVAKQNVAYTRLEWIARTQWCTTSTIAVHCQTDLLLCTANLLHLMSNGQKHDRLESKLILYSKSMVRKALLSNGQKHDRSESRLLLYSKSMVREASIHALQYGMNHNLPAIHSSEFISQ